MNRFLSALGYSSCARFALASATLSMFGLMALFSSGCSSLAIGKFNQSADDAVAANAPTYKVIFEARSGQQPRIYKGKITGSLTVQQALEASGATRKHRYMLVDLARVVPETGQVLRLPVTYDAGNRQVIAEQNYAVHDGDEILVRRNSQGPLDSVMAAVMGEDTTRRR